MPRAVLSKRPHRGMTPSRFSFSIFVDRLDFGSSENVRANAELQVQWTRGSKTAVTQGQRPFNTAATYKHEQLTLICTLFSPPESPTAFERKSCSLEAIERLGGRARTRGKSRKLDLSAYAHVLPGQGSPFVLQLHKRDKPVAWLKLTIEATRLTSAADDAASSDDSAGTLDDLESDAASSCAGSDVGSLSDLGELHAAPTLRSERASAAAAQATPPPSCALVPLAAAGNPFAEAVAPNEPINPFDAAGDGGGAALAVVQRRPPPRPGASNPWGGAHGAAEAECAALRAQLREANAALAEARAREAAQAERERQRAALVPPRGGAGEQLADELALAKEAARALALDAAARAAEAEQLRAEAEGLRVQLAAATAALEAERRGARGARERAQRATEKQRAVATRMTELEVTLERERGGELPPPAPPRPATPPAREGSEALSHEEELSMAFRAAMEAQERRIRELEDQLAALLPPPAPLPPS